MIFKFFEDVVEIFNKINKFHESLSFKDCHSNDYFTNNNFCEIYQSECTFNEFQNSWAFQSNNLESLYLKTNHICVTKEMYSEYSKLELENFFLSENIKYEISYSVLFSGLNVLTSSNQHLYELNKKLQNVFLNLNNDEIEKFIKNNEIQKNLKRTLAFFNMFDDNFLLKKITYKDIRSDVSQWNNSNLKITNLKNKFSLIGEKLLEEKSTKLNSHDFLILLPPVDKIKILLNPNLAYLLNWKLYFDQIIFTKYCKRYTIESFYEYLEKNYPYLQIGFDEIVDVVDKRVLNKNTARMTIFNLFE